jgi:beta-phosphoglucomutase
MNQRRAVIFDMDGVLVDSFEAHFASWQASMQELGMRMEREAFGRSFGRTSREILESYFEGGLTDNQIEAIDERKELLYRQIVQRTFPAMTGVAGLLEQLSAAGFALAVGSSGPPENVALVVEQFPQVTFEAVVTGRDVQRGKPDPQVFLLAAKLLNVAPGDCAVIEDAAVGLTAARRAGMAAIGLISTGRTREELAAADPDLLVESLADLQVAEIYGLLDKN